MAEQRLKRRLERLERTVPPGPAARSRLNEEAFVLLERFKCGEPEPPDEPGASAGGPGLSPESLALLREFVASLGQPAGDGARPLRGVRPGERWPDGVIGGLNKEPVEPPRPAEPPPDAPPTAAADQAPQPPADPLAALRKLWSSEG